MAAADRAGRKGLRLSASFILCFMALFLPGAASADSAEEAAAFLLSQQRADGAIAGAGDIATAEQATAEALIALAQPGPVHDAGIAFLASIPPAEQSTEYLARLIAAGESAPAIIAALLSRQNPDGGFGMTPNAPSSVLDTAFSLKALEAAGFASSPEAQHAAAYLLNVRSGGLWTSAADAADVATSLHAWHALFPYRHTYHGVAEALDAVLAEIGPEALEEDHLEALRLLAVMLRASDAAVYLSALQAFKDRQQPDGGWSGDVYSTALALRVVVAAQDSWPNPDLASVRGRITDAEYGTPRAGIGVALDGSMSAVTDSSGEFILDGLAAGAASLEIAADGYAPLNAESSLHMDSTWKTSSAISFTPACWATTASTPRSVTLRA